MELIQKRIWDKRHFKLLEDGVWLRIKTPTEDAELKVKYEELGLETVYVRKKAASMVFSALAFVLLMLFSGCRDACEDLECVQELFLFKVVDQQGENLLDSGTVTLDQIAIYNPNNFNDSLPLSLFKQQNETFLEAYIDQGRDEYVLKIEGFQPYDLRFDLDVRSGECCTSMLIEEAYFNGSPIPKGDDGRRTIILP